jgi:hypothetical protein
MPSSGMLRCVALVSSDVWEERIASILRSVLRLLVSVNVVPSAPIPVTLMMEAIRSSEMSVLTRAVRHSSSFIIASQFHVTVSNVLYLFFIITSSLNIFYHAFSLSSTYKTLLHPHCLLSCAPWKALKSVSCRSINILHGTF